MHPHLYNLGSLTIGTYGVAMAVGFIAAILLGVRAGQRQGIGVANILDLAFWIIIASLLGSRLLFVITEAPVFWHLCVAGGEDRGLARLAYDCTRPLHLWEGGLVFYGGLLGAIAGAVWFTRRRGLRFLHVADVVVPLVALGHVFGRLGCLGAGCCYGKVTDSALGVVFPPASVAYLEMARDGLLPAVARATPPLHPTQLYEAGVELGLFVLLTLLGPRKRRHGQLLWLYLLLYPAARFVLELFRADPDRHYVVALSTPALSRLLGLPADPPLILSTSQLISLALMALSAVMLWRLKKSLGQAG